MLIDIGKQKNVSPEGIDVLKNIMLNESAADPAKPNPKSSALGLFQFTKGTWDALVSKYPELESKPGDDGRLDVDKHIIGAIYFTRDNEKKLTQSLGRKPDAGEIYLAHFLGAGGNGDGYGAIEVIKSAEENHKKPITKILSEKVLSSNKGVYLPLKNGDKVYIKDFYAGDMINWANGKMGVQKKYDTEIDFREKRKGILDSQGSLVMVAIAMAVAVVAFVASEISDIFSGDDKSPPPTPSRPRARSRA